MKILSARKVEIVEVETDDPELPYHRRIAAGKWEYLSGLSWEECADQEGLEAAYQDFNSKGAAK